MTEFIGEKIDVARAEGPSPRPLSFTWRGRHYDVAEVLQEWVDTGFGATPPHSRMWYNRHHRRYYIVLTSDGERFKMYFDYADRAHYSWWLVSMDQTSDDTIIR
jgi:hypothetical protein